MNSKRRVRNVVAVMTAVLSVVAVAAAAERQVTGLRGRHSAGQTFLTWREVDWPLAKDAVEARELKRILRDLDKAPRVRYRVYRSPKPITSLAGLEPIAEVKPLSCWNADYHGIYPKPGQMARRWIVEEGKGPLGPGTGLYVHNPKQPGRAYYAVTLAVGGKENAVLAPGNALAEPVAETVGVGAPVLQRIEKPKSFQYVDGPTLHYYVRWETPPNCAVQGKAYDYLVAEPAKLAKPAPVGIHLHCWGGSLNGGYGWWYNAEKGDLLIASNQIPYDWWTGYHEKFFDGPAEKERWQKGVVRPYSQRRMLAFLDWVATKWDVDLTRTHVAGSSMGGSGAPMFAIRWPDRIAWAVGWVGVHDPAGTPHFKGSYEGVYGKQEWAVKFEDGTNVWNHFSDAWYLRKHPDKEVGFITFSNGKNDGGIGWAQAAQFWRALQETHRPHVFVWGQSGHGQRAAMPLTLGERVLAIDVRTDASLPAFSRCSLDDRPGTGDPKDGDPKGQSNLYLYWKTADAVDTPTRWEMTLGLVDKAPRDTCTVTVTPRRCRKFRPGPGAKVTWTAAGAAAPGQQGTATADRWGLVTLKDLRVGKAGVRVRIEAK